MIRTFYSIYPLFICSVAAADNGAIGVVAVFELFFKAVVILILLILANIVISALWYEKTKRVWVWFVTPILIMMLTYFGLYLFEKAYY